MVCVCVFTFFLSKISKELLDLKEGRSGAVNRVSDFGPRGPWFDSPPVHISLWP